MIALVVAVGCVWNPPAQYDREPRVPYTVIKASSETVDRICRTGLAGIGLKTGDDYRGCALPPVDGKTWRIYIVKGGYKCASEEAIIRHEKGHLNGWRH